MEENESTKRKANFMEEPSSLSSLIKWNVSKALEKNPCIDLKCAIRAAQNRMETDVESMVHQYPEERHLACALLAWQQLGHNDAESLYKFVEDNKIELECTLKRNKEVKEAIVDKDVKLPDTMLSGFDRFSKGPVVKLPMETKIVMRLDSTHQTAKKKLPVKDKETTKKIDAACCLDSECVERLALLDAATSELRERANKLAKREAERVELLERAEAAWRDLELGYQRRLALAEEKEEDMTREMEKLIEERNGYKSICTALIEELKVKGEAAELDKNKLVAVEKDLCDHACIKLRLSEECARAEAALAEQQCKVAQLDRDLQFKEEQTRRKKSALEGEEESARALSIETERTMRGELSAMREQIKQVSNDLLLEDSEIGCIKEQLEKLRQEKMEIIEDLEGCKETCDMKIQGRMNEIKQKREKLAELKEKDLECRCKLPVDETVEVKRTPSLAALCRCTPDDKLVDPCSCTSLRERLISNLLSDLFAGLQAELGGSGAQMPCQLLKCLEDKHNWDKSSVVKTNLRNFFSQLLMGELDIAIATSIEKYHAKWVGASCADEVKMIGSASDQNDGWEERAIERKAQKLATKLAEQLFQDRAEQLVERAKEIVKSGPPPCECQQPQAVFPCLVKTVMPTNDQSVAKTVNGNIETNGPNAVNTTNTAIVANTTISGNPGLWKRTQQDVIQLRLQIENLKKDSIKKEDLKIMEQKITKMVLQASGAECKEPITTGKETSNTLGESSKKEKNTNENKWLSRNKLGTIKKKVTDVNSHKKIIKRTQSPLNVRSSSREYKRFGPAYAVNLCLCAPQKESNVKPKQNKLQNEPVLNETNINTWKQKMSKENVSQISCVKHTKPTNTNFLSPKIYLSSSKSSAQPCCRSDCICFHRKPSNTSIDKLLETLTKWKCDLAETIDKGTVKTVRNQISECIDYKISSKDQNSYISYDISRKSILSRRDNDTNIGDSGINKTIASKVGRVLPPTTESEYMGAINLEKSHDKICNCVKKYTKDSKNKIKSNSIQNSNLFKCINSDACNCKQSLNIEPGKNEPQTKDSKSLQNLNPQQVQLNEKLILGEKKGQPDIQKQDVMLDDNFSFKKSEPFPCKRDYCIKFLGVTLTNANSVDLLDDAKENQSNSNKFNSESNKKHDKDDARNRETYSFKPKNNSNRKETLNEKYSKETKENNSKFKDNIIYNDMLHRNNVSKDNVVTIKKLKSPEESCICCKNTTSIDDSKEIEVNVFHLLEDHLKGKLEEFKAITCKSSCFPTHEEEKIFADIMQKVKQVISDCANDMKCKCPGENVNIDGSWNRAYGLLQEYLKIKIQRVQCLCVSLNDDKNIALGNILDKVGSLIEDDFERLKDICKCKNNNGKCVQKDAKIKGIEDMPEKDINTCKYEAVLNNNNSAMDKFPKCNPIKSILFTENISSQVPPDLGMATKSCDAMSVKVKNMQTTETDDKIFPYFFNPPEVNKEDCDCYCNTINNTEPFLELLGTKELLVSICTDIIKKTNTMNSTPANVTDTLTVPLNEELNENEKEADKLLMESKHHIALPYIGYTVDCTCDGSLGKCICMKSIVQANNSKIKGIWNSYVENNSTNKQNLSYIMNSTQNKSNVMPAVTAAPLAENDTKCICEMEMNTTNEEELILLDTKENVVISHNSTNTLEKTVSPATECFPTDWYYAQGLDPNAKNSKDILKDSFYYPLPLDYDKRNKSDTQMGTGANKSQHKCECDVVPICHVKMLVENIENNLMNSKCTCDSMTSKVCPVHSEGI